jgi:hypothetical protein
VLGVKAQRTFAIALTVLGATVLAVWYILWLFLPSFNTAHTSIAGVTPKSSALPSTPGLARRVIVLFVDGISFDDARSLEELTPLRREGVFRPLAVPYPSYTDPAITSLVTGLDPIDSGMRLNGKVGGVPGLDSVTATAAGAKVAVRIRTRGWEGFGEHLRPSSADITDSPVHALTEIIAASLRGPSRLEPIDGTTPARELSFVYILEADKAGHIHGAASTEYKEACRTAASLVAMIARTVDLEQDAIIAVSDHGHLPRGGHGGAEPEVRRAFFLAAGSFVRRGVELDERPLRDVASTIAVLTGIRAPLMNQGRPMLDALTLDDQQRSFVLKAPFDQAARLLCRLRASPLCDGVEAITARLEKPDPEAWPAAEDLLDTLVRERAATLAAEAEAAAERRLTITGVALALLIAALAAWKRRVMLDVAKLSPITALHAIVYAAALALQGYRASFSTMTTQLGFYKDAFIASIIAIAVTLIAVRALRLGERLGTSLPYAVVGCTVAPLALLAAWVGLDPKTVPPPVEGVLLLIGSPVILSACLLAIAATALAPRPKPRDLTPAPKP